MQSRSGQGGQLNIVDEIKSRCNIVDVIGRVVTLKKAGQNYKGLCPFHNEKTPSFVVSEQKQRFTCFGCGESGDVISFVERYYNLDFKGAAEMLAKEYGIDISFGFGGNKNRDELYEINRMAAMFFYKALREGANPGYSYMRGRGISDETLTKFGIGYADDEWTSLTDYMAKKSVDKEKLVELGLASKKGERYYDKFRGRVIFPIINTAGKVIGFGGRILGDGQPKYLNSPETPVFKKKDNLYSLNLAKDIALKEDRIVLVEGYMDVISLYQAGIRNVSASLGTALTEEQARLIKRYTSNVILSYDADQAGQNAADRGLDILYRSGCKSRVLKVTDGKDPDDFIKAHGPAAFADLMDKALPFGDFKFARIKEKYNLSDEQQRIDFVSEAIAVLRFMKPVEADMYIGKLSAQTGISEGAIRTEYEGKNRDDMRPRPAPSKDAGGGTQISLAEQDVLKLMLLDHRYTNLPEDIRNDVFRSPAAKEIHRAIITVDRGRRPMDINGLKDLLDQQACSALDEIMNKVIPADKEKAMFEECMTHIRLNKLKREDLELREIISMADESTDKQMLYQYMQRQMDIQKEIRSITECE